jgi:conjugal transfer pilus assembly protein TraB
MSDLPPAESADELYNPNAKAKNKQSTIFYILAAILSVVAVAYLWSQFGNSPDKKVADTRSRVIATADLAKGQDGAPEVVNGDLQRQLEALQRQNDEIAAASVTAQGQAQAAQAQQAADRLDAQNTIDALQRRLEEQNRSPQTSRPAGDGYVALGAAPGASPPLGAAPGAPSASSPTQGGFGAGGDRPATERPRRSMSVVRVSAAAARDSQSGPRSDGPQGGGSDFANKPGGGPAPAKGAASASFFTGKLETYDTARYVPPNAYATAKVLVGVDSAAGVAASADPKPVMFRLTGAAISVGSDGRYQSTDLKGCLVNGAAYGELSSEKVYIKLQRITCPMGANKFSVATVEGYVSQRGKAGVRGRVVERAGGLTMRAAVAGTLQGLGTSLSQNMGRSVGGLNASSGAGGLLATEKLSGSEIAQGAAAGGVSNAASMLAEYYIKRAEQYQPVIEMPTGTNVEIVFLSGFQVRAD